ncbi:MAG: endonuclease, partial [Alphaproteobacteria bacterium]|nr:endonuclease [Alphaproteobacteria bacterium]
MRSKQEQIQRSSGVGGSDAGRVMTGDWFALWEEKTGRREPEDLTDVLQVQIGIVTESLNLWWF